MSRVAWMLAKLPAEAVDQQWQRWMRQYWQNRLDSIPLQLTFNEASAMAAWIVYLTDSIENGVQIAQATPAGLGAHAELLTWTTTGSTVRQPRSPDSLRTCSGARSPRSGIVTSCAKSSRDCGIGQRPRM
jgi:Domain of unknown function (DUF4020)